MDNINIYDNFFNQADIDLITSMIFNNNNMESECVYRSPQNRVGHFAYFQRTIKDDFFQIYIKNLFYNQIVKKKFNIIRCLHLMNLYGQSGSFHADHEIFNHLTEYKNGQHTTSKYFTIMIYVNVDSSQEAESSIIFKTNKKHLIEIETKHNRVVMFPGYSIHYPTGLNRFCKNARNAITFKCEYVD